MKKYYILFILIVCLFMTGCKSKETHTVGTLDLFNNIFTEAGFTVSDNMSRYQEEKRITGSMLAKLENGASVEMVTYDTSDTAKLAQDGHIDSFNLLKSTGNIIDKDEGENYYKYVMISNGYYMISSRIDNTLVFSKVPLDNKDLVENTIKDLGY